MRGSLKLRRVEIEECDQTCGDEKIEEKKKEKKRKGSELVGEEKSKVLKPGLDWENRESN